MFASALLLVHLVSFAAYLGAGFGQLQLMKRSRLGGITPEVRADREAMAAGVVTNIELPAIMGSVASGLGFIVQNPTVMRFGWLHGKLICVVLLAVLSHLEMFNARAIVKLREAGGNNANDAIDARKRRHELFGTVGAFLVIALLVLVTFVRLG